MKLLRELLFADKPVEPLVVSCANCTMTMWASSDNALASADGFIYCRECAGPEATVESEGTTEGAELDEEQG